MLILRVLTDGGYLFFEISFGNFFVSTFMGKWASIVPIMVVWEVLDQNYALSLRLNNLS